ncbi:HNH endonuclease [Mesoplasma corruscae]|uniref:HNH endonuclease n=1 Tax=Mesoplasma corruscae TaxID=216874 RepID=A0A2S5REC2_9MOLU|nr:HNH endonuclease [Mesoplasma corruscae]PPE05661.1 HNH endonuclease [Mesoplasma corruscae]
MNNNEFRNFTEEELYKKLNNKILPIQLSARHGTKYKRKNNDKDKINSGYYDIHLGTWNSNKDKQEQPYLFLNLFEVLKKEYYNDNYIEMNLCKKNIKEYIKEAKKEVLIQKNDFINYEETIKFNENNYNSNIKIYIKIQPSGFKTKKALPDWDYNDSRVQCNFFEMVKNELVPWGEKSIILKDLFIGGLTNIYLDFRSKTMVLKNTKKEIKSLDNILDNSNLDEDIFENYQSSLFAKADTIAPEFENEEIRTLDNIWDNSNLDEDIFENYQSSLFAKSDTIAPEFKNEELEHIFTETKKKLSRNVTLRKQYYDSSKKCELCFVENTFLVNDKNENYFEIHHLIPHNKKMYELYKKEYGENIRTFDYWNNLVSLCPNCHRKVHFSKEEEQKKSLEKLLLSKRTHNFIESYGMIEIEWLLKAYKEILKKKWG